MSLSPKALALSALYRNCLFASDAHVDAHEHVANELADHVLRWKHGAPDSAMFKGELNHLRMYVLRYGAGVEVTPRPFDDFSLVHTSLSGGVEIECDGHTLSVAEGRTAVLAPKRRIRLRWLPGTQQLIVRVPNVLMELVASPERAEAGLVPGFMLPRSLGSQWDLIAQSLLNILSMPGDTPAKQDWVEHFERNLALFILAHQPDQPEDSMSLQRPPLPVLPGNAGASSGGIKQLDAVLEYMDSRLCAPISLEDLARVAGVSYRTLNALCHRYYGATPMELLRNIRLDAVRARLLVDPTASITETALAFGFGHLGRFANYYHQRFMELPRDTQKRLEG